MNQNDLKKQVYENKENIIKFGIVIDQFKDLLVAIKTELSELKEEIKNISHEYSKGFRRTDICDEKHNEVERRITMLERSVYGIAALIIIQVITAIIAILVINPF